VVIGEIHVFTSFDACRQLLGFEKGAIKMCDHMGAGAAKNELALQAHVVAMKNSHQLHKADAEEIDNVT
jgi:hypothetical protein